MTMTVADFHVGDHVRRVNVDIGRIPAGTLGTVIKNYRSDVFVVQWLGQKYPDTYYEDTVFCVELLDDQDVIP